MNEFYGYYEEQGPLDEIFFEAKNKLEEALKSTIKYEIEQNKNEVEEIKKQNLKLKIRITEVEKMKIDLENERKSLKFSALGELMGDREVIMWRVTSRSKEKPKCEKCNENRFIEFKYPSGKIGSEACECKSTERYYLPQKNVCSEMRKSSNDKSLLMWFKPYEKKDGYSSGDLVENVWIDEDYSKIEKNNVSFKTEEEAQKYCDYLNREGV